MFCYQPVKKKKHFPSLTPKIEMYYLENNINTVSIHLNKEQKNIVYLHHRINKTRDLVSNNENLNC